MAPPKKAPPPPKEPPPLPPKFRRHSNPNQLYLVPSERIKNHHSSPPAPINESVYQSLPCYPPLPSYPPPPVRVTTHIPSDFPAPPLRSPPPIPKNCSPPPVRPSPPIPLNFVPPPTFIPEQSEFSPTFNNAPSIPVQHPPPLPAQTAPIVDNNPMKRPLFLSTIEAFNRNNLNQVNKIDKPNQSTGLPNELVKKINELRELLSK